MGTKLKKEYLNKIRERYKKASESEKSVILSEFCLVCGYNRKYAITVLNSHKRDGKWYNKATKEAVLVDYKYRDLRKTQEVKG